MKQRWQDWLMLIFGAWVFFSPFWMPAYASRGDAAAWNSYIFGAIAFLLAWGALATKQLWEEWLNLLIGIWLIIAPFLLRFYSAEPGAGWNQIILGILMGIDAIWVLSAYRDQLPASTNR
jgi:SPW repeat